MSRVGLLWRVSVAVAIAGTLGLLVIGVASVIRRSSGWLEFGAAAWPILTGLGTITRMRYSNGRTKAKQDVLLQALPPEQARRLMTPRSVANPK